MSSNLLQLLQIERLLVNPTIKLAIDLYSSPRLFKDLLIEFVLTKLEICLKLSEIWVINKNLQSAIFSRLWLSCNLSGSCRRFRLVIFLPSCITAYWLWSEHLIKDVRLIDILLLDSDSFFHFLFLSGGSRGSSIFSLLRWRHFWSSDDWLNFSLFSSGCRCFVSGLLFLIESCQNIGLELPRFSHAKLFVCLVATCCKGVRVGRLGRYSWTRLVLLFLALCFQTHQNYIPLIQ